MRNYSASEHDGNSRSQKFSWELGKFVLVLPSEILVLVSTFEIGFSFWEVLSHNKTDKSTTSRILVNAFKNVNTCNWELISRTICIIPEGCWDCIQAERCRISGLPNPDSDCQMAWFHLLPPAEGFRNPQMYKFRPHWEARDKTRPFLFREFEISQRKAAPSLSLCCPERHDDEWGN